ncbi:MAG: EAL domain-containing protein [Desulfomicrobiaceae bacterium]|nr:EAL domain-containing protein [Desulfomicrobiaceae bacterium]
MQSELQQLQTRILHLEEELLFAQSVLAQMSDAGCFHQSLNRYASADAILQEADHKLRQVLPLVATAFFLIDEATADIEMRLVQGPEYITQEIPQEIERLREERLVAQALVSDHVIFRTASRGDATLVLHGIATRSRVRGLFLGVLQGPREDLRESALTLLRVALGNLAHTLESFELYRMLRSSNRELEERNQALELARARFHACFELMPLGLAILRTPPDEPPNIIAINAAARRHGRCTQDALPAPLAQMFPCIAKQPTLWEDSSSEPRPFGPLACHCHGDERWIQGQVVPVWPNEVLLLFEDATQQHRMEEALAAARRLTRMLEDNARDLTLAIDEAGILTYVSPSARRLLGADPARLAGMPATDIIPEEALARVRLAQGGSPVTVEAELVHHSGEPIACELVASPLRDDEGHWDSIMVVARDIRERKALEARLSHQALHDGLTGLPQRELFLSFIQRAIQTKHRDPKRTPVVFLVEFLRFSQVAISFGQRVADAILLQVARRLQEHVRAHDAIARLGENQFGILLDDPHDGRALIRLQRRLRQALEAPYLVDNQETRLETAWGLASILEPQTTADEALRQASLALAHSKKQEHRRVQVFRPSMRQEFAHRAALEQDLARALEESGAGGGPLDIYFQPLVRPPHFTLWGFEALARWNHPHHGFIPPAVFIPLAEETGLIDPLGRLVLERACLHTAAWNTRKEVHLSVNLSTRQLLSPDLAEHVRQVLAASGLSPHLLTLEITESTLMTNPAQALTILQRLRQLGIGIAIDDFGTGYSSLAYLHQLPVTSLKIDRSFVATLSHPPTQNLVRTILSLAFSLGLQVTAEGVESSEQALFLAQSQTHFLQGFLFSRPVPATEAEALLSTPSLAP